MKTSKNIAFVVPYPFGEAPSQRFRFEQYFEALTNKGFSYRIFPFYSVSVWQIMYGKGKIAQKAVGVFWSIVKRFFLLFGLWKYDFVFIHRETAPLGPPIYEWVIAKILRKKIIYDFDDAIWLTDEKARLSNVVRCFWKVGKICRWAYKVSCGNNYLADYARRWNDQVVLNPTTIDTTHHAYTENLPNELCVIGWTGSHSTLKYLTPLFPVLKKMEDQIKLVVICNENPACELKNYEFILWSKVNEIEGLTKIDIGIMPLPDDEWTLGKCGFKALQYMSMKKAVVISPIGVNKDIIEDGVNGLLAKDEDEWLKSLALLIEDEGLRNKMALRGYQTLMNKYSVDANKSNFLNLFA